MNLRENLNLILSELPAYVKLVAVSKTHPVEAISEIYEAGQKIFGENKVQELVNKQPLLPADIEWHMIGHLQTNKVKFIIPFVSLIHGVDSFKLLQSINKEALKINRTVNCLLQLHIAKEETKFGFSLEEIKNILASGEFKELENINIVGLMGMATFTDDEEMIRSEFKYLADCFKEIKNNYFNDDPIFKEISMGMSDDYRIAVEEGSTMVRIGTAIFGKREYLK